jgi:uncharacterized membrane protein
MESEGDRMRSIIRILFLVTVGLASLSSYRGHLVASIILSALAGGLWVAYFLLYARGKAVVDNPAYFEPVSFVVGVCFVGMGMWSGIRFLPRVPTVLGAIFIGSVFVVFPIVVGVAVIRRQLRRPRHPNLAALLRFKSPRS